VEKEVLRSLEDPSGRASRGLNVMLVVGVAMVLQGVLKKVFLIHRYHLYSVTTKKDKERRLPRGKLLADREWLMLS
jgi:fatty-acid desaturase